MMRCVIYFSYRHTFIIHIRKYDTAKYMDSMRSKKIIHDKLCCDSLFLILLFFFGFLSIFIYLPCENVRLTVYRPIQLIFIG